MSTQSIEINDVSELPQVASIILEYFEYSPIIIFNGEIYNYLESEEIDLEDL